MKTSDKMFKLISPISLLALMFFIGLLLYWTYRPYRILETTTEIVNENKQVKAGDCLILHIKGEKYMDFTGTINRHIKDGFVYRLSPISGDMTVGKIDVISKEVTIPSYFDPGIYYYEVTILYKPNPIRTIEINYGPYEFEVIK